MHSIHYPRRRSGLVFLQNSTKKEEPLAAENAQLREYIKGLHQEISYRQEALDLRSDQIKKLESEVDDLKEDIRTLKLIDESRCDRIERLMESRETSLAALNYCLRVIHNSDSWWIDSPNKGGFDVDAIKDALIKIVKTR